MKFRTLALFCAMTLFVALGISDQTFAQKLPDKIITFDVPGAGTRLGRSPGTTLTRAPYFTASCAIKMESSLRSTRALTLQLLRASTRRGRSREATKTRAA